MALAQDDCSLCFKAERELKRVSSKLKCLHKKKVEFSFWKKECQLAQTMSDPILLQVLCIGAINVINQLLKLYCFIPAKLFRRAN